MILSKNPNKTQLSDIFKEYLGEKFSKKLQNAWLGNNQNLAKNWEQNKVTDYIKGRPFDFIDILQ